jgi:hypothetical protein
MSRMFIRHPMFAWMAAVVFLILAAAASGGRPALAQLVPTSRIGEVPPEPQSLAPQGEIPPAFRQQKRPRPQARRAAPTVSAYDRLVEQANNHTVAVVSGTVNGSYIQLANDMSFVLDDADKLRVLPVIGRGGYENIYDVLLLKDAFPISRSGWPISRR